MEKSSNFYEGKQFMNSLTSLLTQRYQHHDC